MIRFDRLPWEIVVSRAERTYPRECCGALLGTVDGDIKQVKLAVPMENAVLEQEHTRYELRPEDLLRVQREARDEGLTLIGIFHSHPDCEAYFSQIDLKNSCPWYAYVVVSIREGKFDHARCWLPSADQTQAREERIEW